MRTLTRALQPDDPLPRRHWRAWVWLAVACLVAPAAGAADLAVTVRHGPVMNGRIEGSLWQFLGESGTLNSGAVIRNDWRVPGTPRLVLSGNAAPGATLAGPGSASPINYSLLLNSGVVVGRLVTRTDAGTLPLVPAPATPAGTRSVTLTSPGQSPGSFATLKHLTLNGNVGNYSVPAGSYGNFIANGGSGFILGVAGATQPAVYGLQNLTLNGGSTLTVAGPVELTLANAVTINAATTGSTNHPEWLTLKLANGGLTLNSSIILAAAVQAPAGQVIINGGSLLLGSVACDRLTVNSGGVIQYGGGAPANQAPSVEAGADQSVSLPNPVTLAGWAGDDGLPSNTLAVAWTQVSGPGTVTFDHAALTNTTATFSAAGAYGLRLTAHDGLLTNSDTVTITAVQPNRPPVANPQSLAALEDTPLPIALTGSDPDGDPLSFTVTRFPTNGVLSGVAPNLVFTPGTNFFGADAFEFKVNDGRLDSPVARVSFDVQSVDDPPVVRLGPNQLLNWPSNSVTLTGTVIDDGQPAPAAGQILAWTQLSGPGATGFNPAGFTNALPDTWPLVTNAFASAATFSTSGVYVLRLTATSAQTNAFREVTVTVNHAPIVDAGGDQIAPSTNVTLRAVVTDDGLPSATLAIAWTQLSGPGTATFLSPTAAVTAVSFSASGVYTLRLAADDGMASVHQDINVYVYAPTLVSAGPPQTVASGTLVQLRGSARNDTLPPGTAIACAWSLISGPGQVLFTDPHALATAAAFTRPGVYALRLTAQDRVATNDAEVTVTVQAANQRPRVFAGTP